MRMPTATCVRSLVLITGVVSVGAGCSGGAGDSGEVASEVRKAAPAASEGALQYVPVRVSSDPAGARVFFVPDFRYSDSLLSDADALARWEVHQGRTNVETNQLEQLYIVVFERNGDYVVKKGVRVIHGLNNQEVHAVFDTMTESR